MLSPSEWPEMAEQFAESPTFEHEEIVKKKLRNCNIGMGSCLEPEWAWIAEVSIGEAIQIYYVTL